VTLTSPDWFHLDSEFISQFIGKQPEWGSVGYVTYKRTYARDLDTIYPRHTNLGLEAGLLTNEEYWLTLVRVVEGTYTILMEHCRQLRVPFDSMRAQRKAQSMFQAAWEFKWTPPGRGLWMMGTPIVAKLGGLALNNCAFVSTKNIAVDFAAPFCTLMDYSMLGVGVGFDARGAGTLEISAPRRGGECVIADTREGWVQSLGILLRAYAGADVAIPEWNFSQIRPSGAPIRGFGGTASGPGPLIEMLETVDLLLASRVGSKITVADITDVGNLIGRCVVAGNVRRSAEIVFGEPDDEAFLELKDPEKNRARMDSHGWASNNSVFATVGQSYTRPARLTAKNGEPGYFWLENAQRFSRMGHAPDNKDEAALGGNPCLEQTLEDNEVCCLVETYPAHHANAKEFHATLKHAYLYAKCVTLLSTHNERTNAVMLKNRRIGCSMAGVVQAMKKFGRRKFWTMCDDAYAYVQELDREYSNWLCVPRSNKTTSVKPGGTVPLLSGATPGTHHPHSRYYWRVIRFATDSTMLPFLRDAGYPCVEIDPAKEPNTIAVYFPVEEKNFDRGEKDVSMWEQLEVAAAMQEHWADNQVSCTVKFDRKEEGSQIAAALEFFETRLKGISFLPHDDHGYEHAPYQEITKTEYEAAITNLKPLLLENTFNEIQDKYCDGDKCAIPVRAS